MIENTDAAEGPEGRPDARDRALPGLYPPHLASVDPGAAATVDPRGPAEPVRELLATVSDRIRNPLQVILARADLMEDEETAVGIREQVCRINDAVKYLEDILSDSHRTGRND